MYESHCHYPTSSLILPRTPVGVHTLVPGAPTIRALRAEGLVTTFSLTPDDLKYVQALARKRGSAR